MMKNQAKDPDLQFLDDAVASLYQEAENLGAENRELQTVAKLAAEAAADLDEKVRQNLMSPSLAQRVSKLTRKISNIIKK